MVYHTGSNLRNADMSDLNNKNLIILTGPTAVGKTELSIALARSIGGEIISADSVQVYRHMNIGSAKISVKEMCGIPHHLIDVLEPNESFSVALFKELATRAMKEIYDRGHIPIIVGGTGFYIQSVLYDIEFEDNTDDGYRKILEELYEREGAETLYDMLIKADPAAASCIHPNNVKRVIRALEYTHQTGRLISEHNETERAKSSPYNHAYFVLNCDREMLYKNIEKRVDMMLERGLVDEVRSLVSDYHLTRADISMQGLGYKEIYSYLAGECTLEDAIYTIKRDTRHFAKRQLTWFRRERDVVWVNKDVLMSEKTQLDYIMSVLASKDIYHKTED